MRTNEQIEVMKHLLMMVLSSILLLYAPYTKKDIQAGDVVFIESQSSQSPYIKLVQMSKWTHCGIVVKTPSGYKILEASNVVKLTSFDDFISKSKNKKYLIARKSFVKNFTDENINIDYQKYLGIPYDLEFKFNNGKYYCSELVYEILVDVWGDEIPLKKVSDYWFTKLPSVKKLMKKRNIDLNSEVIAPVDIFKVLK